MPGGFGAAGLDIGRHDIEPAGGEAAQPGPLVPVAIDEWFWEDSTAGERVVTERDAGRRRSWWQRMCGPK
jgi:hypothetical protein